MIGHSSERTTPLYSHVDNEGERGHVGQLVGGDDE